MDLEYHFSEPGLQDEIHSGEYTQDVHVRAWMYVVSPKPSATLMDEHSIYNSEEFHMLSSRKTFY